MHNELMIESLVDKIKALKVENAALTQEIIDLRQQATTAAPTPPTVAKSRGRNDEEAVLRTELMSAQTELRTVLAERDELQADWQTEMRRALAERDRMEAALKRVAKFVREVTNMANADASAPPSPTKMANVDASAPSSPALGGSAGERQSQKLLTRVTFKVDCQAGICSGARARGRQSVGGSSHYMARAVLSTGWAMTCTPVRWTTRMPTCHRYSRVPRSTQWLRARGCTGDCERTSKDFTTPGVYTGETCV